jgi:predicted dehydrogenase
MPDRARIGLIGCGEHGRGRLASQLVNVAEASLVACADPDEEMTGRAMDECGFERAYGDYSTMLEREDIEGVVVAVPHDLLKDITIDVLRSGRHVFVEKPMGVNAAEAREVQAAAAETCKTVMVGYCQRFNQPRIEMKRLLDNGVVGDIVQVNAIKGGSPYSGWLADPKRGGGPLRYIGVHITDQILWMLGSEPERVYGEIVWHPETGADQSAAYTVRFRDGVLANVLCSQSVGSTDRIEVIGTEGYVRAEWPADTVQVRSDVMKEYREPTTLTFKDATPMLRAEMQAWVASIRRQDLPPITPDDGIRVLEIIDAVFESGRRGTPVELGG